jgi:hypothetical protein
MILNAVVVVVYLNQLNLPSEFSSELIAILVLQALQMNKRDTQIHIYMHSSERATPTSISKQTNKNENIVKEKDLKEKKQFC